MKIKNIFVVGSGVMGSGIAQACAQAGYQVTMMDMDEDIVTKAMEAIEWSLSKMEEKRKLEEPKVRIVARIKKTTLMDSASKAHLVVEAIYENLEAKQNVFNKLEEICPEETILGTNTSSIPITEIAAAARFPERFVGIHFFNPVHRMQLVEIVKGLLTAEKTVNLAKDFVLSLRKEPVMVNRDSAGFIVGRINGMALLEALRLLERGTASVEDIDKAMRLGFGHPMGPFELMDLIGLDIVLNARMSVYNETREACHFPPGILQRMVKAGYLGRKTKKGFYDYSE